MRTESSFHEENVMHCSMLLFLLHSLISPSRLTVLGLSVPIHRPNGQLAQGANHILTGLLRRGVEGTLRGLFHGCSHPNLSTPPILLQSGIPGGHHPACPCAHPVPGAVLD